MKFRDKLILLYKTFLYLFNDKTTLYLVGNVSIAFGHIGLFASHKVLNMDKDPKGVWEEWSVTFNGKKAIGYVNGVEINNEELLIKPLSFIGERT
jgi:hypothetical protein